tara:strand:+ start:54 stop:1523 length:1470 start_codon:yes stop_codon:yes gene_type:complete
MGGGRKGKKGKKGGGLSSKQKAARKKLASLGRAPKSFGGPTKAQNLAKARIAAKKTTKLSSFSGGNKQAASPSLSAASFSVGINNPLGITPKSIKESTSTGRASQFTKPTETTKPTTDATLQQDSALATDNSLLAGAKTGFGLRPDGVTGEYKEGDVFNTGGKSGVDYKYQGEPGKGAFVKLAGLPKWMTKSVFGDDPAGTGKKYLNNFRDENAADETKGLNKFFKNIQLRDKTLDQSSLSSPTFGLTASTNPMAIQTYGTGGITEDASSASGYSESGSPLTKTEAMSSFGIGGLNLDNLGGTGRALPTGNPNVMSPDGTFNRPGPTPENTSEANYTSYKPGSFYNQSDTNRLNVTNLMRSTGNIFGMNNIPKSNEAIQDAADQRSQYNVATKPRPTQVRRSSSGGARLTQPTVPTVQEELLLPVEQPVQTASTTGTTQTGVDTNRLLQIQQQAYQQAFNPMSIGGFNPQFRFASRTPRIDYSTYFNYS